MTLLLASVCGVLTWDISRDISLTATLADILKSQRTGIYSTNSLSRVRLEN